jgi:hypothetical protein
MWLFSYGLLTEYGTESGSLAEGARDGFDAGIWFGVVAAGFSIAAARVAGGTRIMWLIAALVLVAGIGGPFVGGALAARHAYAALPDVPFCYDPELAPSAAARRVERAFSEINHPAKFYQGDGADFRGCGSALIDIDPATAEVHYRRELPRHGWTLREDTRRLIATRDCLTFRLTQQHSVPHVHIGPVLTTRP